jgi:TolB protein
LLLLAVLTGTSGLYAQTDIFVRGSERKFPIALPQLCSLSGGSNPAAGEIADIMARNLALTGDFEILEAGRFVEQPGKCASRDGLAYSDWSIIGADGLVKGELEVVGTEIVARMFLHDVPGQSVVVAKEYRADIRDARRVAHRFANEIVKFFTGRAGVFGSQIAFSGKTGRFKELFVMDMDGSNMRQLTDSRGLVLYPSWSPDGEELLYTSYENRYPDLYALVPGAVRSQRITNTTTLELGSAFFRERDKILASVATPRGGAALNYLDRQGRVLRKLPGGGSVIDISPDFAPDFSEFAFCSNRGGGPQIYV